jgi:transcription antitermination protein NusB
MEKVNFKARQKARRYALQALFQWHFVGGDVAVITQEYLAQAQNEKIDTEYFHELVREVTTHHQALDQKLLYYTGRVIAAHNPVELAVLRLGAYELIHRPDVPSRVVLNEAIELTKKYGTQDGYKYVNGVLDKLAHRLRKDVTDE